LKSDDNVGARRSEYEDVDLMMNMVGDDEGGWMDG